MNENTHTHPRTLKDIMSRPAAVVSHDATLRRAAHLMRNEDIGALLVSREDGLGVITDRDIVVRAVAVGADVDSATVGQYVSADLVSLPLEATVSQAVTLMGDRQVRRLAVVEDGKALGVVSVHDLSTGVAAETVGRAEEDVTRAAGSAEVSSRLEAVPGEEVALRDVMTQPVYWITPDTSLRDAAKVMRDHDVGALPIVDDGQIVGIVTDRDIVINALARDVEVDMGLAGSAGTAVAVTVDAGATLQEGAELMARHRIRRLIVTEQGRLAGMVSIHDISQAGELELAGELDRAITL